MGLTADICDTYKDEVKLAEPIFQQFGRKKSFYGQIHTVQVLEDNVLVKDALQTIPANSILVVDGGGSRNCALMGDNLAAIAENRNLAGVIIYGCIRDSGEINAMNTGVFALGTHPFKSIKQGKGRKDITVQFAGVTWEPGAWVYVDEDGVLISRKKLNL